MEGIKRRNSDTSSVIHSDEDEGVDSSQGTDRSLELGDDREDQQLELTNNLER